MKWLTKSDYLKFLIHPAYLWLAKHAKHELPPFDEIAQANVAQGNAVEAVAAKLFPGAHLIDAPLFDGPDITARLMAPGGPDTLIQASILTNRKLYVRSDILVRNSGVWDLYEVKSSASVKTAHLLDLAFQRFVLEEAGYTVGRSFVIHINNQYVRDGAVDPAKLLTTVEVTDQIEPLAKDTAKKVEEAFAVMTSPTMPPDDPAAGGDWFGWRDVYRHLHPDIPAESIYNLTRLSLPQIVEFHRAGITKLSDIPETTELVPEQIRQLEVARAGQPIIHREKMIHILGELKYPLYFLDYETFASAIPLWDGVRPFQQLPFQYSLHIIEQPGGDLVHREFLARGGDYPVTDLLQHLEADLGPAGSVVVWYKPFEMGCNDAMAALHPEFADFLKGVNERVFDLMEIFSNGYYAHPKFMGSSSIKKVLPVLVPELSYKHLDIGEGLTAQIRWVKAARGELSDTEAAQVYEHLVTYCGQDTLAMVRIYEVLRATLYN
jgi:hypothetical protein